MDRMADRPTSARIALTSAPDVKEAEYIARTLVEERLAACATIIPAARSIYRWKDAIEDASESLILLKTGRDQIEALEARLIALHSYQTPEFLVLAVDSANPKYLNWLEAALLGK